MHKVSIRPEAEDDLEAIYGFIVERSPSAAIRFVREIRRLCMSLAQFPNRGAGRDRRLPGVRIVVMRKRVTIAYRVHDDVIDVIGIFYRGRDYAPVVRRRDQSP
jgi:toxin ParE1/3/4